MLKPCSTSYIENNDAAKAAAIALPGGKHAIASIVTVLLVQIRDHRCGLLRAVGSKGRKGLQIGYSKDDDGVDR